MVIVRTSDIQAKSLKKRIFYHLYVSHDAFVRHLGTLYIYIKKAFSHVTPFVKFFAEKGCQMKRWRE